MHAYIHTCIQRLQKIYIYIKICIYICMHAKAFVTIQDACFQSIEFRDCLWPGTMSSCKKILDIVRAIQMQHNRKTVGDSHCVHAQCLPVCEPNGHREELTSTFPTFLFLENLRMNVLNECFETIESRSIPLSC